MANISELPPSVDKNKKRREKMWATNAYILSITTALPPILRSQNATELQVSLLVGAVAALTGSFATKQY